MHEKFRIVPDRLFENDFDKIVKQMEVGTMTPMPQCAPR
jgi:hypothetical protein